MPPTLRDGRDIKHVHECQYCNTDHAKCHKRSPNSQESQKEKEFNLANQKDAT